MKLGPQQQAVYHYLKEHPASTIREIRDALHIMKPDMRISEINFAYRQAGHNEDLIINVGKNKYREVLKSLRKPLTKFTSQVEIINGVAVERRVEVPA